MQEAWQVADLLDQIARNAEPLVILKRQMLGWLHNVRLSSVEFMVNCDPGAGTVTALYFIPLATAMTDVDGTPEQVIEWLSTGLSPDQTVCIGQGANSNPCFIVQQIHRDQYLAEDVRQLLDRHMARIVEQQKQRARG